MDDGLRIAFCLAGAVAVGWNLTWFWLNRRLLVGAAHTQGTVTRIDVADRRLNAQGILFRYVVCYRVGDEVLEVPARPKVYGVGSRVTVRYRPEAPSRALAGWLPELLFGPFFMLTWGTLLIWWSCFPRS